MMLTPPTTSLADPRLSLLTVLLVVTAGVTALAADERPQADVADSARPEWIWGSEDRTAPQSVVLSRTVAAAGRVTQATARLAAEFTTCRLVIGTQEVLVLDDYGPWLDLDVADFLRPGENLIALHCRSSNGPAAVLFSLTLTFADGGQQTILSNSAWQAQLDGADGTDSDSVRGRAASFGPVASHVWDAWTRGSRVTPFDDYTQWKQALQKDGDGAAPAFKLQPGFEIEHLRTAQPEEGSWVSMAFDPEGRLTIAREERGLLRFSFSNDGHVRAPAEVIDDTLLECRGLLYAYGAFYVNANDSKAMYRLRDTNGDDQFDEHRLLREFPGALGHGRNDLALGPDGMIYSIHGDAVDVPQTDITDRTSPFREVRRGQSEREGHLVRTDPEGKRWELVASGLRNPFGIDFNADGELFTYDADAEFDMGAPWYRATRLVQLASGADYGWRGRTKEWPPYQLDHADNALPVVEIGKGSPTAVKFGTSSSFPPAYREALFVLDWAYGRVLACHLTPRGAGYVGLPETFLQGRPLNVTDLDFGPDGAMYLITGGRKTESSLYRVQYRGPQTDPEPKTRQQLAREPLSRRSRAQRRELEAMHVIPSAQSISKVWPHLASADPVLRHAARVAVEHQPVAAWQDRTLNEPDPHSQLVALLALSRSGDERPAFEILQRLNEIRHKTLSAYDQLSLLHSYQLCLEDAAELDQALLERTRKRLTHWLSQEARSHRVAPEGAGGSVLRRLCHLVTQLGDARSVPRIVELLRQAQTQPERMDYLFILRGQPSDSWTIDDRRTYFQILGELERSALGGDGMPGFLQRIRDEARATLTEPERDALGELLNPAAQEPKLLTINRDVVREWTLGDQEDILAADPTSRNLQAGEALYGAVLCRHCHRHGSLGGVVGPDLSSVGSRFSRRDILASILDPSRVVAEQYRTVQIVTQEGQVVTGRVLTSGDYRSPTLRIATDPLDATKIVEIPKIEVELHQESTHSPMPQGLLNTLTKEEILDLLAYVQSAPAD